ncbi:hypothetical protein O1C99_003613 [Vibrio cholerae]|nr:hypothetical protein [Vibrio cholerae]
MALFLALVAFIGYLNDGADFYNNYVKQKRAEDGLEMINTGVSIQHVKSIFGPPIREEHQLDKGVHQYLYSFKNFYLQVVYDNNNTVVFFSVTSKNEEFKPKIPYLTRFVDDKFVSSTLGHTFEEYSDSSNFIWSSLTSKFFDYYEYIYLGNPGNYRNLYFGFNPAGIEYSETVILSERENPSQVALDKFRKSASPNTYGVGEYLGDHNGPETMFGIGIDYYNARDLPEHQY